MVGENAEANLVQLHDGQVEFVSHSSGTPVAITDAIVPGDVHGARAGRLPWTKIGVNPGKYFRESQWPRGITVAEAEPPGPRGDHDSLVQATRGGKNSVQL